MTEYRFICAGCGDRVAGFDVEPPPSWAKTEGGWLCEDCKTALFPLRPGAGRAPACPKSSVPSVAQGSNRPKTASPPVDSTQSPAGRNGAAGDLPPKEVGR